MSHIRTRIDCFSSEFHLSRCDVMILIVWQVVFATRMYWWRAGYHLLLTFGLRWFSFRNVEYHTLPHELESETISIAKDHPCHSWQSRKRTRGQWKNPRNQLTRVYFKPSFEYWTRTSDTNTTTSWHTFSKTVGSQVIVHSRNTVRGLSAALARFEFTFKLLPLFSF